MERERVVMGLFMLLRSGARWRADSRGHWEKRWLPAEAKRPTERLEVK